jgi:hypothetical protein
MSVAHLRAYATNGDTPDVSKNSQVASADVRMCSDSAMLGACLAWMDSHLNVVLYDVRCPSEPLSVLGESKGANSQQASCTFTEN